MRRTVANLKFACPTLSANKLLDDWFWSDRIPKPTGGFVKLPFYVDLSSARLGATPTRMRRRILLATRSQGFRPVVRSSVFSPTQPVGQSKTVSWLRRSFQAASCASAARRDSMAITGAAADRMKAM